MSEYRRIEVSTGGKWYLVFTIAVGVVAIQSGNNIMYLLESLLLSSMIFSGIFSEQALRRIEVQRKIVQAYAEEPTKDLWIVENKAWFPIFCLELGEWEGKKFTPCAFIPLLGKGAKIELSSEQIFPVRGEFAWEGIVVATAFPFGFARKLRILTQNAKRIVWPKVQARSATERRKEKPKEQNSEFLEGEILEVSVTEGIEALYWPKTILGVQHFQRKRAGKQADIFVELDVREKKDMEPALCEVANFFYQNKNCKELRVVDRQARYCVHTRLAALNYLALWRET